MQEDNLREILEDVIDDPKEIDEVLLRVKNNSKEQTEEAPDQNKNDIDLDMKILEEKDWRKRARLVAMKISRGLDN